MKRFFASALLCSLVLLALPAGAAEKPNLARFALNGEARALEVALGDQGLTLGFAMTGADSTPRAFGVGAGQCAVLGESPSADSLPCNEATMSSSDTAKTAGALGETCAGPAIPAPLDSTLKVEIACGGSFSELNGLLPTTINSGRVGEVRLNFDVAGIVPEVEEVKDLLIDQLQGILDQAPEPIKTALNQVADTVDAGQALQIKLGPADSSIVTEGNNVTVKSFAAGAVIGVAGLPDINANGQPIPGTSIATEDGLLIIEIGPSRSEASVDSLTGKATSSASAAVVVVKVRDITKVEPSYIEIPVSVGQSVTLLEGTPAESTISVSNAVTENSDNSARAAADAVSLHLLKGVQGGVKLSAARTAAAAQGAPNVLPKPPVQPEPEVQKPEEKPPTSLPLTGGTAMTGLGLALLFGAAGALVVRRKMRA